MQVFNAYFKIIKKHWISISIYLFIFALVAVVMTVIIGGSPTTDFTQTRGKIAVFDEDNTPLSQGLSDYLSQNNDIVELQDDKESIEDALFFEQVTYVIRIPAGFTQSFVSGSDTITLKRTAAAQAASGVYADLLISKYLNGTALYLNNLPDASLDTIAAYVAEDLSQSASVTLNNFDVSSELSNLAAFFRYFGYSLLAIGIMGVTTFMMAFNKRDFAMRNQCAPISPLRMNLQILLGNAVFGLVVWALLCILSFVIYGGIPGSAGTVYLMLNALVFTMVSLSVGFLAGKFVKGGGAQSAITNVVSLGVAFLSGMFVPQVFLGNTVLTIASFTPGYWYVRAVDIIQDLATFSLQEILPVLYCLAIQAGFAAAILIIALLINKQRKTAIA